MAVMKVMVLYFILTAAMENFGVIFWRLCMAKVTQYQ